MAAYAALVSLLNDLELIPNHPIHSFSFDNNQITTLSQIVIFLVDFMDRYDLHGYNKEAAEVLESEIADAAHAAHDVIETHVVDQILSRSTRSYFLRTIKKTARHILSTLGRKPRSLHSAIKRMNFVKREATQLIEGSGLIMEEHPIYSAPSTSTEPPTTSFKGKSGVIKERPAYSAPSTSSEPLPSKKNRIVGFDAVVDPLLNMLTGEPSKQRLAIPIVGMGGIGKTTLAKYIYENSLIKQHFYIRLWATISYEYSVETIIAQLVSEITCTPRVNVGELGAQLHMGLWGRRYLIVLDDMWSVDAWDGIQRYLPDNGNGSRIVVTTRMSKLAAYLNSSPFRMNFLDEETSWQLLCEKAFGEENCSVELERIGRKIVKRCKGLPLSIVVIGGHLKRSSREIGCWEKVFDSMNPISSSVDDDDDDQCFGILGVSYQHLPPCLKPCFLYMGVFKEDEPINASKLLRLWVAEGFVRAKTGQTLEKVAEDYLNDLIERNLILVGERKWNGKVESCAMHDSLRELCLKIATKEKFLSVLDSTKTMGRERRIVIRQDMLGPDVVYALESSPLVRSLRRQGATSFDKSCVRSTSLRLLRVSANFHNVLLEGRRICLLDACSRQVNLRYLAFSSKRLTTSRHRPYLASSISLFWNMQSMDITNFDVQISASRKIWEMSQLRHLEFRGFGLPDPAKGRSGLHKRIVVLENLQTLVGVENLRLKDDLWERMPNIKELSVFYDHFPDNCSPILYYCPHNLGRFTKLESLSCEFGDDSIFPEDLKWRDVVRHLTFPTSLEELCLWNSNIRWEDLTRLMTSLPRLASFKLNSVRGTEWDLVDQEFTCLKVLWISKCDELVDWNANSSHFPVLEILRVWAMPNLSEIPFDIGDIPTFGLIELFHCSVSAAVSAMRLAAEQESCGNMDILLELQFQQ